MKTKWIGMLSVVLGLVLGGVGMYHWHSLLAAPLETQPGVLAQALIPLVGGFWLFVAGVCWLRRAS